MSIVQVYLMHPLDGPRLKIRRAESHIDELDRFEQALWRKNEYKVVKAEFNPETGKNVYRVRTDASPFFPELGVQVGEIAHNLRSALDGLIHQLALLKTETPAFDAQFPIFLVGKTRRRRRKRRGLIPHFKSMELGGGRSMIRDLRPKHRALIERLQPYKSGRGGRRNPLWQLHEINNADKHRLIQVVASKWAGGPVFGWWGEDTPSLPDIRRRAVLKDGTKLFETSLPVDVKSNIFPLIAFLEGCPAVKWLPLRQTLSGIAEHVSEIVESFAPELS